MISKSPFDFPIHNLSMEKSTVFDMQREKTLCNLINRLSQPKKDNSFLLALNTQLGIGNQKINTGVIKVRILPCRVKWG